MDLTFEEERLEKLKALITAYDDALLALAQEGVDSYSLDTGQSRQTVHKIDLEWLKKTQETLMNQYATLCARLGRSGQNIARPAW